MLCIIMSTYNGTKYLSQQLDSLVNQECVSNNLIIYVRDDGSSDNTVSFIEEYAKKNLARIIVDKAKNCGASESFMLALKQCPNADYYAFCDQDDVWMSGKLITAIKQIGSTDKPTLWYSNYDVVDSELNVIKAKAINRHIRNDRTALFYNNIPGCVMVFNHALMLNLRKINIDHVRMHDIVALNIALITGKVVFNHNSYIKYRQHGSNVIGYSSKKIIPTKWIIEKTQLLVKKEKYSTADYARELLRVFYNYMNDEQRTDYLLISNIDNSISSRIKLLKKDYLLEKHGRTSLSIRLKLLLGIM